ncbi:DNA polymerase IV, partial [Streptomyces javensis]|nr:DNA polymerase IV [Streptomyces javensis]
FEEPWSPPGRIRTFPVDDPALQPADPLPLLRPNAEVEPDAEAEPEAEEAAGQDGGQPVTSRP